MLSRMETGQGLTIIGPKGQTLRILRTDPIFGESRELARTALPAEQLWDSLTRLTMTPLQSLIQWAERFGVTLEDKGSELVLDGMRVDREPWLELLRRMKAVAAPTTLVSQLAKSLSDSAKSMKVGQVCLLVDEASAGSGATFKGVLMKMNLPEKAAPGYSVVGVGEGTVPFLVSYAMYADSIGNLTPGLGTVIRKSSEAETLLEPAIFATGRTYRCEEGTSSGWVQDMSFDCLAAAKANAKEIADTGSEVRIINRISGDVVWSA